MRWLFGILLLANLSLFVWKSGDEIEVAQRRAPAATVPGVPGLTLLSESAEPEATTHADRSAATDEPPPEPPSAPEPAPAETAAIAEETPPGDTEPPEPEPYCVRLGPFAEEKPARDAITDLAASRVFATLTTEGKALPPHYIVYLPPAPSRKAALETLRELRSKQIDSFVFSRGELRNGVSLGLFSQLASAKRLLRKMQERGYDARMVPRDRETQRFWISLGPNNSVRLTPDLQAALRERYGEAEYNRVDCP